MKTQFFKGTNLITKKSRSAQTTLVKRFPSEIEFYLKSNIYFGTSFKTGKIRKVWCK